MKTLKQMEAALRSINFFVGGLTDAQIEYYYKKMVNEGAIVEANEMKTLNVTYVIIDGVVFNVVPLSNGCNPAGYYRSSITGLHETEGLEWFPCDEEDGYYYNEGELFQIELKC